MTPRWLPGGKNWGGVDCGGDEDDDEGTEEAVQLLVVDVNDEGNRNKLQMS